ncbi:hypothetical protein L3Q82_009608 [Scortum barcoo]|uniref:Uncharacterized protein n=1 Tax=Scortum barcoo TaxID=214431 RepID=A0ACB8WGP5_9TELE|nr:hypothetical protein L3Q82_009608 [Scortum barcoo]
MAVKGERDPAACAHIHPTSSRKPAVTEATLLVGGAAGEGAPTEERRKEGRKEGGATSSSSPPSSSSSSHHFSHSYLSLQSSSSLCSPLFIISVPAVSSIITTIFFIIGHRSLISTISSSISSTILIAQAWSGASASSISTFFIVHKQFEEHIRIRVRFIAKRPAVTSAAVLARALSTADFTHKSANCYLRKMSGGSAVAGLITDGEDRVHRNDPGLFLTERNRSERRPTEVSDKALRSQQFVGHTGRKAGNQRRQRFKISESSPGFR